MKRTKRVGGKRQTYYVESGVQQNPAPTTERGKRRAARRENRQAR